MSINGLTVTLKPYSQQPLNRLEKGILTATGGSSGTTSRAWIDVEGRVILLSPPRKQDRLTEGFIRLEISELDWRYFAHGLMERGIKGDYAPIDSIGRIEKELWGLEAGTARYRRAMQTMRLIFGMRFKPADEYLF